MLLTKHTDTVEDRRTDEEVLSASIDEPELFRVLVRRYECPFLGKAQRIVGSRENAEDVVQETFTKIYVNASRFEMQEGASFSSWAYRILINTAISYYRKLKRAREVFAPLPDDILEYVAENIDTMEEYAVRDLVASVLTRIPRGCRGILQRFFLEEKSHKEIAEELGITEVASKTQLYRAKKKAYEVLENLHERNI
jgi:RNA polymerase sigma-70 factor (ECF subfamily)